MSINEEFLKRIKPRGDNLYVKMIPRPTEMRGVETAGQHQQRTELGIIKAVGGETSNGFASGDMVMLSYNAGIHIQLPETYTESQFHRIIAECEILAKIDK